MTGIAKAVEGRARQSLGRARPAIHALVERLLVARSAAGTLLDVGCGTGDLARRVGARFGRIIGVDAVRYDELPANVEFVAADVDAPLPLADGTADVTAAVEVIEHLENPRAFMRELVRVTRPAGWIVMTTPNQLSALSLLTLIARRQFSSFQDRDYPAHRTALLEIDLRRIAAECGLDAVEIAYSHSGRVPLTAWHYPGAVAGVMPRALSDNLALIGRRCASRS